MNMKKTIAAIAAGSVAVSAMATTVSAVETKTLTYSLVREATSNADATATITATFSGLDIRAGESVIVRGVGFNGWKDVYTISGSYYDDNAGTNKSISPIKATHDLWGESFSVEGEKLLGGEWAADGTQTATTVTIPVVNKSAGTNVSLVQSTQANITVTVKAVGLNAKTYSSIDKVNEGLQKGNLGIQLIVGQASAQDAVAPSVSGINAQGLSASDIDVSGFKGTEETTFKYSETAAVGVKGEVKNAGAGVTIDVSKYTGGDLNLTYKDVTNAASPTKAWVNDATGEVIDLATLNITLNGTPSLSTGTAATSTTATQIKVTTGSTAEVLYGSCTTAAVDTELQTQITNGIAFNDGSGVAQVEAISTDITFTWDGKIFRGVTTEGKNVNVSAETLLGVGYTSTLASNSATAATPASTITITGAKDVVKTWTPDPAALGVKVNGTPTNGDSFKVKPGKAAVAASARYTSALSGNASKFSAGTFVFKPFKTDEVPTDVISYLENNAVNAGASKVNKDVYGAKGLSGNYGDYRNVKAVLNDAVKNYSNVTFKFNTATQGVRTNSGEYSSASWEADYTEKYMAFGQYLYNDFYNVDASGFTGFDWAGQNLFAGALVVNEGLTMSLGDTDYFDWTETSISFDWDAIIDGAATNNDYATYIQSLGLATSATWYWDNMEVILTAGDADDVTADAGVEGDDETLDTDDGEEEDDGGEVIDDGEEDDGEEDIAPVETEAPVVETEAPVVTEAPVAQNPQTGNASVALAVIPVALAAAAIVAKKRG